MNDAAAIAERMEQRSWEDLFAAPGRPVADRFGLRIERLPSGLVIGASAIDHFLFNRAIGVMEDELDRVVDCFGELGVRRYFVQPSYRANLDVFTERCAERGLQRYTRRWAKFLRGVEPLRDRPTSLPIGAARVEEGDACGAILADAFDLPAEASAIFAALIDRPRWHVFAARDGEHPVAVGMLFVDGTEASLVFAATRPQYRGRGAQRALMARRLRSAGAQGCRSVVTETGEAIPDEPNISYQNILWSGFREVHVRPNYALPGAWWRSPLRGSSSR